jgi:hypothetical protein
MPQAPFVDFYDVLQLSPNATAETVERVYRLLAKRYHPDNQDSGDSRRFAEVHDAFLTLSDPERRAQYDVVYEQQRGQLWKIFDQQSASDGRNEDRRVFHGVLSLLYVAKRRDPHKGGMGVVNLERLLGVPQQHLDFPLWYLKKRGWIELLDNGQLAITVDGVDKVASQDLELPADRLLPASSLADHGAASTNGNGAHTEDTREPSSPGVAVGGGRVAVN